MPMDYRIEALRKRVDEEQRKLERMAACGAPSHLVALQRLRFTRVAEAAERIATSAHPARADD